MRKKKVKEKLCTFLFLFSLFSCVEYIPPTATIHVITNQSVNAQDIFKLMDQFAKDQKYKKIEISQDSFYKKKALDMGTYRYIVHYDLNKLTFNILDYEKEGYVIINIIEDNKNGFTKSGINLFNDIYNYLSSKLNKENLIIVDMPQLGEY